MQRAGSNNMCLNNHIVKGCINPLQSRIIMREPKYLDLKLKSMKLLRKKFISCEVTNDPTQAYILNNHQVDPSMTVPQLCLKRQAAEMDFFIQTASHQVNVLIGEEGLKFSCFPAVDVSINGQNVTCHQGSSLNPSVRTLHSFKMEEQEFIEEAINSYKFLANSKRRKAKCTS